MPRLPALRPALLAAPLACAGLLAGCAPDQRLPCNSDDDCLRSELCADGYCGLAGDEREVVAAPARRGQAAAGELDIDVVEAGASEEPAPAPEPEPPTGGEPLPDWADAGLLRRAVVHIQGVAGVVEPALADLPVLVELDATELGAEFLAAARQCVLFTTRDNVALAAELDADRGSQMFFWVKYTVDARPNPDTPDSFLVYAGGATTLAAPAPHDVWSTYFGVYHMGAARDVLQPDATGARSAHNEDDGAETVPCTVGACVFFDGTDDRLVVPSAFPELAGATQATISATVRLVEASDSFIAVWSTPDQNRSRFFLGTNGDGVPQAAVRTSDLSPSVDVAAGGPALVPGVEHGLDAVLDMASGTLALYVDGQLRASDSFATNGALPSTTSAAAAMGAAAGALAIHEFDGRVDEVRITARERSADFVRVDAASRAGQLTVVTLDQ